VGIVAISWILFILVATVCCQLPAAACLAANADSPPAWQLLDENRHRVLMLLHYGESAPPEQYQIIRLARIAKSGKQRMQEGARFAVRNYSQHQEEYLLDCSVMTAALKKTMVFDKNGKLVRSIASTTPQEVIIPETELDMAVRMVCPDNASAALEDQEPELNLDTFQTPSKRIDDLSHEESSRIAMLTTQASVNPLVLNNWVLLGNACYEAELTDEAIKAYDRALAIKPDSIEVLVDQGTMYRKANKPEQALLFFERALKLAPDNLEALYSKGFILSVLLNKNDEGFALWRRYLELDNNSETARQLKEFMNRYSLSGHTQQTAVANQER